MKKNILKVAIVAMFGLFAGYNVYTSQVKDSLLSDLVLNNVEALAQTPEIEIDFCIATQSTCKFYRENGNLLEVKGDLQYSYPE